MSNRLTTFLDKHFPKNIGETKDKSSSKGKVTELADLVRETFSIADWIEAVEIAEDVKFPDRIELARLFKNLVDDDTIYQCMQIRTASSIGGKLSIQDAEGNEVERITDVFFKPDGNPQKWFRDWLELQVETVYYGALLLNFGDIVNGRFEWVKSTDYQNVIPEKGVIIINTDMGFTLDGQNTIPFNSGIVSKWCYLTSIKDHRNLGLLNKCAPYYIWKNDSLGNWSMFQELYGVDTKIGKTDTTDDKRRIAMDEALANSVGAAYMTVHTEDEVEFISSGVTDSYNTFKEPIVYDDKAINKIILGQTSLADDKSFVGSVEVQERAGNLIIVSDKMRISDNFESQLIPFMQMHGLIPDGEYYLIHDLQEKVTMLEMADIVDKIGKQFKISPDTIEKRFNMEVEEIEAEPETAEKNNNLMAKINNILYNG